MNKRLISILLIFVMIFTGSVTAFADTKEEVKDERGISWEFTSYDQRNGNYESVPYVYNGNTALPATLSNIAVGTLTSLILLQIPLNPTAAAVAGAIVTSVPSMFQSSNYLYFTKNTYEDKLMPGWYRKFEVQYYYDAARTVKAGSKKIYYGYRA